MKASYQYQLNNLISLLDEISSCLVEELKYVDRELYTLETELNFLEFAIRKHLSKKHVLPLQQEQVITFFRQHFNNSHVAILTTNEGTSLAN
ncbi:hypothetical protein MSG37_02605 [Shewanella sp. 1CM18E]|uniref:hypothetical protein n=1 Tax=Shewanella sp. 1CM18E TaxID=2929169 RepID=UPI0020BDB648|nr:hypothetical protein [Shewanella sp. 1CM18E]MCK8043762.1 hypothetical protein [Shewanella sp. 1CM18E]